MELHDQAVLPWGNANRAQAREAAHRQTRDTGGAGCPVLAPLGREAIAVTRSVENSTKYSRTARSAACRTSIRSGLAAEIALHAMAVEFPQVHGHPNRLPFEGVLTLIDVPSDKAPSGARGHRVILTRAAAEAALPSLLGMAVDYKAGWDGHDARQTAGFEQNSGMIYATITGAATLPGSYQPAGLDTVADVNAKDAVVAANAVAAIAVAVGNA